MMVKTQRRLRQVSVFVLALLAIELLDELVFGVREAAWPLIRDDLGLTYAQVGLLLSIPGLIASFIEPLIGILGDVWKRRLIILGGGVCFAAALLLTGVSQDFALLMASFIVFYPSSGAFVSLSQAALMDFDPTRHEQNMARWTLAGSLGVVGGPLLLGAAVGLGGGWRDVFLLMAALTVGLLLVARRFPFPNGHETGPARASFLQGVKDALLALRRREVVRWLVLLQFSDLMLDVLLGYLALYFVDVVGVSEIEAGAAVALWTGVGLVGDFLLIPLLERVSGLIYLRISAALELALFPAFLLVDDPALKLAALALMGFFNAGWYAILQGRLYSAMPGQSGSVMAVGTVFSLGGVFVPLGIGLLAEQISLGAAMWVLLLGPLALLIGLPRR
ncbi:MAG: MFS transporter [Chloroflexi bacterium]|nr:MFS transporter [Chloroflexota bacterium]MDL1886172.1 MFS transporter [Anaerolineae bacterium CFX8]